MTDDASNHRRLSPFRLAAERLYEDTRLRDGLDDSQAEQLLSWGLAEIERLAARGANLSPEEIASQIEEHARTVRELIVRANRLVDGFPLWSEQQRREQLASLIEWLCRVRPHQLQLGDLIRLEALSATASTLSREELFNVLFRLIAGEEEE